MYFLRKGKCISTQPTRNTYNHHMKKSKHSSMYLIISLIFVGILLLWSLGSWLVVRNIEEPSYTLVERGDGYELRDYAPYIVAEVEVSGNRDQSMRQ